MTLNRIERLRQAAELTERFFESITFLGVRIKVDVPFNAKKPVALHQDMLDLEDVPSRGDLGHNLHHQHTRGDYTPVRAKLDEAQVFGADNISAASIITQAADYKKEPAPDEVSNSKSISYEDEWDAAYGRPNQLDTSQHTVSKERPVAQFVSSTREEENLPFKAPEPAVQPTNPIQEIMDQHICAQCGGNNGEHATGCPIRTAWIETTIKDIPPTTHSPVDQIKVRAPGIKPTQTRPPLSSPEQSPGAIAPEKEYRGVTQSKPEIEIVREYLEKHIRGCIRTEAEIDFELLERLKDSVRIVHAIFGMLTELGEFADIFKKFIFYGKGFDHVNAGEEIGDLHWYLSLVYDDLEQDPVTILETNLAKLRKRFPEKFTQQYANERDLEAERKLLDESLADTPAPPLSSPE